LGFYARARSVRDFMEERGTVVRIGFSVLVQTCRCASQSTPDTGNNGTSIPDLDAAICDAVPPPGGRKPDVIDHVPKQESIAFPVATDALSRVGRGGFAGLSKTWMFLTSPHGWVHGVSRKPAPDGQAR
jgi:hypothetical protein